MVASDGEQVDELSYTTSCNLMVVKAGRVPASNCSNPGSDCLASIVFVTK
jgi:hypothetical protein